ncbi:MAG: Bax inhibitor-1/YccA family protein [Pseudomonadota bacterium]
MSYDPYQSSTQTASSGARVVDAGLQAYMQSVFRTMAWGLAVTGLTAYGVFSVPALFSLIFGTPLSWVVILAPLGFIWFGFSPAKVRGMSSEKLRSVFILFSAVMGLSMAALFAIYTGASIARVFFITAAMFAATSLYGYTTKRDLTGVGSFMAMGLFGIVIAMVVNIFLGSAMVQFVVSALGVVIFTGLTAWETQRLRDIYADGATEANAKMAVMGALGLYLNFINLFQFMLQFMGQRR